MFMANKHQGYFVEPHAECDNILCITVSTISYVFTQVSLKIFVSVFEIVCFSGHHVHLLTN